MSEEEYYAQHSNKFKELDVRIKGLDKVSDKCDAGIDGFIMKVKKIERDIVFAEVNGDLKRFSAEMDILEGGLGIKIDQFSEKCICKKKEK